MLFTGSNGTYCRGGSFGVLYAPCVRVPVWGRRTLRAGIVRSTTSRCKVSGQHET